VANEARIKLKESLDQIKDEILKSSSQVADELQTSHASEDYNEIELKRWMKQLQSLKQCLLSPPEIELYGDTENHMNASIIRSIQIKVNQAPRK
jgi:hypothetical protein